ncbi:unnamed protein product [Auanema sp. JU1783]|nr:unnamed protein product [Auanema sp. JU1783]
MPKMGMLRLFLIVLLFFSLSFLTIVNTFSRVNSTSRNEFESSEVPIAQYARFKSGSEDVIARYLQRI